MGTIANKKGCTSVMIFHNHPNHNPNQLDCTKPSQQDLISADDYAIKLDYYSVNILEFICERGRHYQYYAYHTDSFYPLKDRIEEIEKHNGTSMFWNLRLHLERIF
jgi:hypothetical protein